jgi:molybdopterin molybdotransferase
MKLDEVISCVSGYDPDALPVSKAREVIAQFVKPVAGVERLAVRTALSRVLAHDLISPIEVPAHDNSAMDGFALRGGDLNPQGDTQLVVAGTSYAGTAGTARAAHVGGVKPGQCLRIMTGAVMPEGCDTVVPQEFCRVNGEIVTIPAGAVRSGDNRRLKGEDLSAGQVALAAGKRLTPADLGLIASLGMAEVSVRRKLRVAFFSTGNELRSVGEPLDEGCVYDSNRYTLFGMLSRLGCEVLDMGVVRDEPVMLEAALRSACESADVIITSGGVSVGEADFTKQLMAQLGDVAFWKIAMRPGRPMAFGGVSSGGKRAVLFGLPGNPVAVMVTFYHFVRDALVLMQGAQPAPQLYLRARSNTAMRKKPGRTEYQRGIVARSAAGGYEVSIAGNQGSGILRSMSLANCFVVLHHEQGNVNAGDEVDVLPFDGLI